MRARIPRAEMADYVIRPKSKVAPVEKDDDDDADKVGGVARPISIQLTPP